MSDFAIQVRDLGKRYTLRHAQRSLSLRETLTQSLHRCGQRLLGSAVPPNPTREEFWALRDLSFDIPTGETVAIVGPNGAGKSTLLKILSRVTNPTTGRVEIAGRVASLLEVGTGFHPELTGRENVFLSGAILGMSRGEILAKFDEIVAFAGVENFIDTPVKRYSSGMYTRLAFAVSVHLDFEILIVDEVLSVGDAAFQAKSLNKMKHLMETGRTILFVSHNLMAAQKLCKTAIHLEEGQLRGLGPAREVIAKYLRQTEPQEGFNDTARTRYVKEVSVVNGAVLHKGQPVRGIVPGEPITVRLQIDVHQPHPFNVELLLRDAEHQPILFVPSGLIQDVQFGQQAGPLTVEIEIKGLLLASGTYFIDTILCQSGVCFYERIENALDFTILPHALGPKNHRLRQVDGFGNVIVRADFRKIS